MSYVEGLALGAPESGGRQEIAECTMFYCFASSHYEQDLESARDDTPALLEGKKHVDAYCAATCPLCSTARELVDESAFDGLER